MRIILKHVVVLAICAGVAYPAFSQSPDLSIVVDKVPEATIDYQLIQVASGFSHPSSIAFLPNDAYLIGERNAGISIVSGGERYPVTGLPEIHVGRQAGLHDVALHPDFINNRLVYFSFSEGSRNANGTALARAKLVVTEHREKSKGTNARISAKLENLEIIFSDSPKRDSSLHYGGRILFLPDGTLLLTTGEAYKHRDLSPKLDNHYGKIIRINDDGTVPKDNPFANTAGAKPEIYTYGHRNPQGLIRLPNGRILAHEHGPRGGDEVNEIRAGADYGWPRISYGINYIGTKVSDYSALAGMEQSLVHFVPSIAPSGFTYYDGELFPKWKGDLFLGGLKSKQVRRIEMNRDGSLGDQEALFTELKQRIRDVETGPDGALYFVTDSKNGALYRVIPK